ncbi:MAG: glycosyltransferase family 2 protein [Spirochaetales bacterium]|jgi:glycosyltransferase involved in cell wall biosynthesis|nr:glycosyltransferase family 2 protein [Spirochaetales bacterium]
MNVQDPNIYPELALPESEPAISVIIPVYNRFRLLSEAVGSVLSQTFKDYELILVDDGSDDPLVRISRTGLLASTEALTEASRQGGISCTLPAGLEKPTSFRCLRIDHTGMPGAARNRGAEAARGRYIAFLDSDDLWLPDKLKRQYSLMEGKKECRISHTRELWLRNGKTVSQKSQKHQREGQLFNDSLVKCIVGPSTVMMDRKLYLEHGGFREDLEIGEDYELWLRILASNPISYVDAPLTIKRAGHGDQLTGKYGHIEYFRIQALKDLVDRGSVAAENLSAARTELSRKCRIYSSGSAKRGKETDAAYYRELANMYSKDSG